jgi:hypothetical protein
MELFGAPPGGIHDGGSTGRKERQRLKRRTEKNRLGYTQHVHSSSSSSSWTAATKQNQAAKITPRMKNAKSAFAPWV